MVLLHYELCQNAPTTDCYIQANLYDIAPRYIPIETTQNAVNFALVAFPPTILGWLIGFPLLL